MQFGNSRRGFLAGSLALSAGAALPAAAAERPGIPQGPMILRRVVEHGLHDGNKIVASREWQVGFAWRGNSIEIGGKQIKAKVHAPSQLREISLIEERRATDGMFPIVLTGAGLLRRIGMVDNSSAIEGAMREAELIISRLSRSLSAKNEMRQAISRIRSAGSNMFGQMPTDLFFPRAARFADHREVDLPNGTKGEFAIDYNASHAKAGPWLNALERRISTQIGEDVRLSREIWTLKPA